MNKLIELRQELVSLDAQIKAMRELCDKEKERLLLNPKINKEYYKLDAMYSPEYNKQVNLKNTSWGEVMLMVKVLLHILKLYPKMKTFYKLVGEGLKLEKKRDKVQEQLNKLIDPNAANKDSLKDIFDIDFKGYEAHPEVKKFSDSFKELRDICYRLDDSTDPVQMCKLSIKACFSLVKVYPKIKKVSKIISDLEAAKPLKAGF